MLRGFYFTSGTQEGTPFDRLTGFFARSFGIDQRRAPCCVPSRAVAISHPPRQRGNLWRGDAGFRRPGAANRRLLLRGGGFALAGLAVLVGRGLLWHADRASRREIDEMEAALAGYTKAASDLPLDPVAEADLPLALPTLDQARALPHGYDPGELDGFLARVRLVAACQAGRRRRAVYRHALERFLLPRLIWRLEKRRCTGRSIGRTIYMKPPASI